MPIQTTKIEETNVQRALHGIRSLIPGILLICLSLPAPTQAGEGFGFKKNVVELERVRPADVRIPGETIDVRSEGQSADADIERQLITSLKNTLLNNSTRLRLEEHVPDALVELSVADSDYQERWETRTVKKAQPTGKDSKGRTTYTMRDTRVKFKVVSHVLDVSYRVTARRSGSVLTAGNATRRLDEDYEEGRNAPSRAQLDSRSVSGICDEIAARITPTSEIIGVLLPGGSLKDLRNLAEGGLWNEYLEGLSDAGAKPKPKDEAYRLYALGVAFEAVSYQAEQPEVSINYLQEAAAHYKKAIQLNPGEKYFTGDYEGNSFMRGLKRTVADVVGKNGEVQHKEAMAPVDRVESALQQYQKVIEHDQSAVAAVTSQSTGAKNLAAQASMTNRDVIQMARSNLSDDIIITAIRGAKRTNFDISTNGLLELGQAEVSTQIIQLIQEVGARQP